MIYLIRDSAMRYAIISENSGVEIDTSKASDEIKNVISEALKHYSKESINALGLEGVAHAISECACSAGFSDSYMEPSFAGSVPEAVAEVLAQGSGNVTPGLLEMQRELLLDFFADVSEGREFDFFEYRNTAVTDSLGNPMPLVFGSIKVRPDANVNMLKTVAESSGSFHYLTVRKDVYEALDFVYTPDPKHSRLANVVGGDFGDGLYECRLATLDEMSDADVNRVCALMEKFAGVTDMTKVGKDIFITAKDATDVFGYERAASDIAMYLMESWGCQLRDIWPLESQA